MATVWAQKTFKYTRQMLRCTNVALDKLRIGKNIKYTLGMDYQEMPQAFQNP